MSKFKFLKTPIEGLILIEPRVHEDSRGCFFESYNKRDFFENKIDVEFVQDNESRSSRGVLRGLHFQKNNPQGKLVRVIEGEVFDVAVDLRKSSRTYGKWFGTILSGENKKQLYIPEGFAHGFFVRSQTAVFFYKCTRFYDSSDESGILFCDSDIAVDWKIPDGTDIIISEKDKNLPSFKSLN